MDSAKLLDSTNHSDPCVVHTFPIVGLETGEHLFVAGKFLLETARIQSVIAVHLTHKPYSRRG